MSSQYGELGSLTAEIGWQVWGIPANFNGFHVLASLISQFGQQRSAEGATYIRLASHHIGHQPTFWFTFNLRTIK